MYLLVPGLFHFVPESDSDSLDSPWPAVQFKPVASFKTALSFILEKASCQSFEELTPESSARFSLSDGSILADDKYVNAYELFPLEARFFGVEER